MSDDVTDSFRSSLDDLKINSKPQISMLTMLAEDHEQYAVDIVRVIEEQIKKVPVSRKLPIMYLIDSIIKNLSTTMYPQLFAQCIVTIFCGVFEEVDEKTRQSMYKLRQTWPDIIPNKQLYLLDRKVQLIDPAWPITAKAPEHGVIHVNPKFLKPKEKEERSPQFSPVHSDSSVDESIREELYVKEKELQKLRLELELAETKAKLELQKKQLEHQTMQKSSKNVLDREPPPVIKLPPVGSSVAAAAPQVNRDPRLYRDPRVSRDPRLKKQQEREEQERLELEKEKIEATAIDGPSAGIRMPSVESVPSVSTSPRMDLATLLNSFSNVAAKVAAEQARKRNPSVESVTSKSSETLSHEKSPEIHSHRSPEAFSHRKSPEKVSHRRSPETVAHRRSPETVPHRRSPETSHQKSPVDTQKSSEIDTHAKSPEIASPPKSPEFASHRKSLDEQLKDTEFAFDVLDKKTVLQLKAEPVPVSINAQIQKMHEPKIVSAKHIDKKPEEKEIKRDKKWSPHGKDKEKQGNKDPEKRNNRDSYRKDRDKRDNKEKDRRDSKDSERLRDRRDSRERRPEVDINRHSDRRPYRHAASEFKRGSYRDTRSSRSRGRDRHAASGMYSMDGRTDQFGRTVRRSKSGSRSRDRSPIDRDERIARSPKEVSKEDKLRSERTSRDNTFDDRPHGQTEEIDDLDAKDNGVYIVPPEPTMNVEFVPKDEKIVDVPFNRIENDSHLKEEVQNETEFNQMEIEQGAESPRVVDVKNAEDFSVKPKQEVPNNVMSSSEDVDMRIPPAVTVTHEAVEAGRSDNVADNIDNSGDQQAATLKRLYPETRDGKPDLRPYKIPKLGAKKVEATPSNNQEDISNLFGEQDVDYRHPMLAAPVPAPSCVSAENLLPPSTLNVKSPAQRRWSQFKESHPNDFAQDMERKRMRDAQMQSMVADIQDVDLRPLTSTRQRSLTAPPADANVPIPKDLSVENQEQILQRAEQELKEGRISHGDHQEIVRQLGQVYDIQKKRHNYEERPSRALDLRDPRLRGIRETKSPFPGDIDRRMPYPEDVELHRKVPLRPHLSSQQNSGDIPDEPSEHSPRYREKREHFQPGYEMSPKEDFDARQHIPSRPRHDQQMGYERHRGIVDDFDGRSPKEMDSAQPPHSVRDFSRGPLGYADYDGRQPQDVDRISELSSRDIDARQPRRNDEDQRGDYRSENLRGPFDEYSRPHHMRGPVMRGEMHPHDSRDGRLDNVRRMRRNTPPSEVPFRGPPDSRDGRLDDAHRMRRNTPPSEVPFRGPDSRDGRLDDVHGMRGNTPPSEVSFRGTPDSRDGRLDDVHRMRRSTPPSEVPFRGTPKDDVEGHRPFGPSCPGPHIREPFINQGPRHGYVPDIRGPLPSFPNSVVRPEQRMPAPMGPRPLGPGPVHQGKGISDPMDDPRWSAMRGLLDNEGTEELVIDGKPFELRMGTSRKLRIYGKVVDVAIDLKERGLRIDGQLVYKLGEPIKEVHALGKTVRLYYHGAPKPIWLDGQQHEMRVDAPPRNVMVDGVRRGFQIDGRDMMILVDRLEKGPYGGPPRKIRIAGVDHDIAFQAPPRRILIDNKSCELKLDSKIPYVIIDGKPHGIRFDGEPRTVYINDQPFTIPVDRAEKIRIGSRPTYIAFGGPAHEIIIDGKWFEVKIDNVPKDIQLGNRHFSIRIPGPLPRVKILDELPPNFDDSRLMSSSRAAGSQPRQQLPVFSESGMPSSMPLLQGHVGSQATEGICPQVKPGINSMHQQDQVGAEGLRISAPHVTDGIHPVPQPGTDSIKPSIPTASEGNLRPIGPLGSDSVRFGHPAPQLIPQPSQPIITQPGPTASLLQPGAMHHGSNPMLAMPRPNLLGFPGVTSQDLQDPRVLQQRPVNLLAQGLLNQVASSMMSSTLQNLPDFAASLRALSQLNAVHPQAQPTLLPSGHPHQPGHPHPPEDHGAAMVTGMQGSMFVSQQKLPPVILPQKPSIHIPPVATIAPPVPIHPPVPIRPQVPISLPTHTVSHGLVHPVVTMAPSVIPGLSQPPSAEAETMPSSSTSANTSIDINSLLNKLLQAGLIKEPAKSDPPSSEKASAPQPETAAAVVKEKPVVARQKSSYVPDMTDFDTDKLKMTHPAVIEQLHEGVQCHTCGARFTMDDHEKYRAHLDWHFRQNKLEQEMVKVAKNRKWFFSITDWIQYEELEESMEKYRSEIFEQMRTGELPVSSAAHALSVRALEGKEVVKNPVASGIEGEDVCATCGDPFDQMWNEETEEWILKNTVKVDGKTYHPVCYEDAQEAPTPVTVPSKNPLELQLQDLPNAADSTDGVALVEVKTEPMDSPQESSIGSTSEATIVNLPVKVEVKSEPDVEDSLDPTSSSSSHASPDINSAIENSKCTDSGAAGDTAAPCMVPASVAPVEVVSCQCPTLLSTIATTVVREVIPVSHEDPMSPWEMDSNPTPELSRTPTPEPIQSFTPAQSLSSESISSLAQGSDSLASEEPLPPALISAAASSVSKLAEGSAVQRDESK